MSMNGIHCDVIGDLLPLHVEGIISEKGRELVEAHLAHCAGCAEKFAEMRREAGDSAGSAEMPRGAGASTGSAEMRRDNARKTGTAGMQRDDGGMSGQPGSQQDRRNQDEQKARRMQELGPLKKLRSRMRRHTALVAVAAAFAGVWAIILLWGLFFLRPGDEMGFALLTLYLLLPLTALVCGIWGGLQAASVKWLLPVAFCAAGLVLPAILFRNFDWIGLFFAGVPAVLGMVIGSGIRALAGRRVR